MWLYWQGQNFQVTQKKLHGIPKAHVTTIFPKRHPKVFLGKKKKKKKRILTLNSKMIYLGRNWKIGLVYRGITHKMETCGL